MNVAPSCLNRSTTTRPSQAWRAAFPERRSHNPSQPKQNRAPCFANKTPMTIARATSRQRGKDFADIEGILYYGGVGMTAPAETAPAVPAPPRDAAAQGDVRKDDPPTAVALWKR